jgi:PAS domain S-box-containing protein
MDTRIHQIVETLTAYSMGQFDKQMEVGDATDEIEACIEGINMLGDELNVRTITTEYFNGIFNSVSEMIFVLMSNSHITDVNDAVLVNLQYTKEQLLGKPFQFIQPYHKSTPLSIVEDIICYQRTQELDTVFLSADKTEIPVNLHFSLIHSSQQSRGNILVTARDRTSQIEAENKMIRAIIETEEDVRNKVAKDLHDSIGQQIAAMHFYFSTLAQEDSLQKLKSMLDIFSDNLAKMLDETHNICFDLMSRTLEEEGLLAALQELSLQSLHRMGIEMTIDATNEFPPLNRGLKINIYRVIQEFISNAVRHGQATHILAQFSEDESNLLIKLLDDGRGFDSLNQSRHGMGLQNVRSRIQSHGGELYIESSPGRGTTFLARIPKTACYG